MRKLLGFLVAIGMTPTLCAQANNPALGSVSGTVNDSVARADDSSSTA